jgi:thiol-disulfide isomerase/thioredoxin
MRGDQVARGRVTDAEGNGIAGMKLKLAAQAKVIGTVVVGSATTGPDGGFEVGRLIKGTQYTVVDGEDELVGRFTAGGDEPVHLALAPKAGSAAPDVPMIHIGSDKKSKLSDLRGKIVVLDFWASWCGPCQAPMAKMQTYREKHPEWGDEVVLIALSIDDTQDAAAKHLKAKGWDKTTNTWAGDGGFDAAAPKAFGIRGIPRAFVIAPDGKIAAEGHPAAMDIPKLVGDLLAKEGGGAK